MPSAGKVFSQSDLEYIAELCVKHNVYVISGAEHWAATPTSDPVPQAPPANQGRVTRCSAAISMAILPPVLPIPAARPVCSCLPPEGVECHAKAVGPLVALRVSSTTMCTRDSSVRGVSWT